MHRELNCNRRNSDQYRRSQIRVSGGEVRSALPQRAAGIYLRLTNPAKRVREILKLTELESVFEIPKFQSAEEIMDGVVAKA